MKLKNIKIFDLIGLGVLLLSGAVACREEIQVPPPSKPADGITFSIEDDNFIVTRSAGDGQADSLKPVPSVITVPVEIGDEEFRLKVSSAPNNGSAVSAPATRGVTYTASEVNSFNVTAITSAGNQTYFNDVVTVDDHIASSDRFWPDEALTFFAHYVPEAALTSLTYSCAEGTAKGTFSYSVPAPSAEGNDAAVQPDMLFAITPQVTKPSEAGQHVPIKFHHALSALVFKLGTIPDGITVKNIRLVNFRSGGDCLMVPENTDNVRFTWEADGEKKTFEQKFPDTQTLSEAQTFMMIPQSFSDSDAVLEINFVKDGQAYKLQKAMKDILVSIDADMKYVFTLGITEVKVEILEDFDGIVKKNVHFKNTGNTESFIRATIIGYWVDPQGDIVAPWTDTIIPPTTSGWRYNDADGFFYYKLPVAPGDVTTNLIGSYSWQHDPVVLNSVLHLNIVAQIISADKFNEGAWGIN